MFVTSEIARLLRGAPVGVDNEPPGVQLFEVDGSGADAASRAGGGGEGACLWDGGGEGGGGEPEVELVEWIWVKVLAVEGGGGELGGLVWVWGVGWVGGGVVGGGGSFTGGEDEFSLFWGGRHGAAGEGVEARGTAQGMGIASSGTSESQKPAGVIGLGTHGREFSSVTSTLMCDACWM